MNFFKKIFTKKTTLKTEEEESGISKYMPIDDVPVDEQFMLRFTEKNGKFLYCDDVEEAHEAFEKILQENDWVNQEVCCLQEEVKTEFSRYNLQFSSNSKAAFYLSDCEYLVSSIGGILVSSNQLKEKKLYEIPDQLVVIAYTSQLIRDISEGLKGIKNKTANIPTNITTIQHFGNTKDSDNFMSYGSSYKNLYLLLIEDL